MGDNMKVRTTRNTMGTRKHVIEVDENINTIAHNEAMKLNMSMKEYYSTIIIEHIVSVAKVNDMGETIPN